MKRFVLMLLPAMLLASAARGQTWAEKLGYPAGKRVLILHADDAGMCYEANQATRSYLENGRIQSASAMAPCPWFDEFAAWSQQHPDLDVGLHLTLTSEWRHYRWGPVTPRAEVPGLLDGDGYLWRSAGDVARNARAGEVEREIRAQLERAVARGIRPSHLDTHMGVLYARPDFAAALFEVAVETGIPAMTIEMTPPVVAHFRELGYPLDETMIRLIDEYPLPKLDGFHPVPKGESYEEVRRGFVELVGSLRPGITQIVFHPSVESETLKRITHSWRQRSWEGRLFADPAVLRLFEEQGILFTDWNEMMRRYRDRAARLRPDSPE